MPIETRFPNPDCGRSFQLADERLDKIGRCTACRTRFRVRVGIGELVELGAKTTPSTAPSPSPPVQTQLMEEAPPTSQPAEPIAAPPQFDPSPADAAETDDRQGPADTETILSEPPAANAPDPAALKATEENVPLEWSQGDEILDLYEVKQVFRGGGMGLVYRVHHKTWNLDLAVKCPRLESVDTEEKKAFFEQECETWINLGLHPNTVSCYYVRRLGGIPRVFAEYVDGGDLKSWIEDSHLYKGGPEATLKRILDVSIQFAWGLAYAHEKGLVHQDVKPANVMMTADGTAKVTDFGLAKAGSVPAEGTAAPADCKVTGGWMTPAYCSPEQANNQKLTLKTDIWSWAVSVLEMFTGDVTWPSGNVAGEALEAYLESPSGIESIPKMPDAVAQLLRHCFQKAPDDRPQDMRVIADELKKTYRAATDEEYPREEPKPAELLADGLNNQALSMLDIGKQDQAEKLFEEALKADAHHPEATYNRGLLLWRSCRITDDILVEQLQEVCKSHPGEWRDEYLLGLVHLERGDYESAVQMVGAAAHKAPGEETVQAALRSARSSIRKGPKIFRGRAVPVNSVGVSPDGRLGLSGSDTVRLWELATGKILQTFQADTRSVTSVSISPDGGFVLSGSLGALRLWDLATGQCLRTITGHKGTVQSVSISSNGRFALSGSEDRTTRLWELSTGKCVRVFKGHTGWVTSVCISPDGRFALSGSHDRTLRLWELATGQRLRTFKGHTGMVMSVNISPNGRFILSGSDDNTLRLWELSTGCCLRTFNGHTHAVKSVSIGPDGQFALSGSRNGTLRLWQLNRGGFAPPVVALPRSSAEITELSRELRQAKDVARRALQAHRPSEAMGELTRARQLPGYERAPRLLELWRAAGSFGRIRGLSGAWVTRTFQGHTGGVCSVCISPDGRLGLSGGDDQTLRLWGLSTGKCVRVFKGHTGWVKSVCISPDGRLALSGSNDRTLRLWDLTTGRCVQTFNEHTHVVNSVCISPDGRFALSGSSDNTLRLWELTTGRCLRTFNGHTHAVQSVCISPDARVALSGSSETLRLWELTTGRCLRTINGQTSNMTSVSTSPDGRLGLSGGADKTLRLWELSTGQCLRTFRGHTGMVLSVSISHDGRWGLSGSYDKTLRLWELASGQCLRTFQGHTLSPASVQISDDARFALSGSHDKTLRLWELLWEYDFPEPTDWHEGARPYLEAFLTLHCPCGEDGISRAGKPVWNDQDFQALAKELQHRGYGWLRPEGVRRQLEKMTREWTGPPPLPGTSDPESPPVPDRLRTQSGRVVVPDGPPTIPTPPDDTVSPDATQLIPEPQETEDLPHQLPPPPDPLPVAKPLPETEGHTPTSKKPKRRQGRPERNTCSRCSQSLSQGAQYCVHCGQRIEPPGAVGGSTPKTVGDAIMCTCGARNPRGNRFCTRCGQSLSQTVCNCSSCQQPVPRDLPYCLHCGKKMPSG